MEITTLAGLMPYDNTELRNRMDGVSVTGSTVATSLQQLAVERQQSPQPESKRRRRR
jgi:hypothetical protein